MSNVTTKCKSHMLLFYMELLLVLNGCCMSVGGHAMRDLLIQTEHYTI